MVGREPNELETALAGCRKEERAKCICLCGVDPCDWAGKALPALIADTANAGHDLTRV
jgi:hypothetical protein